MPKSITRHLNRYPMHAFENPMQVSAVRNVEPTSVRILILMHERVVGKSLLVVGINYILIFMSILGY